MDYDQNLNSALQHGEQENFKLVRKDQMKHRKNYNVEKSSRSSSLIFYFKCFFDLGYVIMVIPFRFKVTRSGTWMIYSHKAHKGVCAVVQLLIVLEFILIFRLIPPWSELNERRLNILHSGNLFACCIYSLSLMYIFWCKSKDFLEIFGYLEDPDLAAAPYASRKRKCGCTFLVPACNGVKIVALLICFIGYALAMTHPIIHGAFVFKKSNDSFFTKMETQARTLFLMDNPTNLHGNLSNSFDTDNPLYLAASYFFTGIHVLILIPNTILVHMLDLFALLITICCWKFVSDALESCKDYVNSQVLKSEDTDLTIKEVTARYIRIKKFIQCINNTAGIVFLCCIGISLPFYASWTAVIFFEDQIDWLATIHFYVYFFIFLLVLTLGASMNKRANDFYDWLTSSTLSDHISCSKITSFMMDCNSNRIALSGCGVFNLTFRFFVTIISIIVTYTSIIVQLQISRAS